MRVGEANKRNGHLVPRKPPVVAFVGNGKFALRVVLPHYIIFIGHNHYISTALEQERHIRIWSEKAISCKVLHLKDFAYVPKAYGKERVQFLERFFLDRKECIPLPPPIGAIGLPFLVFLSAAVRDGIISFR